MVRLPRWIGERRAGLCAIDKLLLVAWRWLLLKAGLETGLLRILLHRLLLSEIALRQEGHASWLRLKCWEVLLHGRHTDWLWLLLLNAAVALWELDSIDLWLLLHEASLLRIHLRLRLIAGKLRLQRWRTKMPSC